jgi:hypothetical protein
MRSSVEIAKSPQDAEEIAFLRRILSTVESEGSTVRIVPFATVCGVGA